LQGEESTGAITPSTSLADLVDESFMAYNAARLREASLFTQKMLEPQVTVGSRSPAP